LNIGFFLPIWRLHRRTHAMRLLHHASPDTTAFRQPLKAVVSFLDTDFI
jgi:hypothetical protein